MEIFQPAGSRLSLRFLSPAQARLDAVRRARDGEWGAGIVGPVPNFCRDCELRKETRWAYRSVRRQVVVEPRPPAVALRSVLRFQYRFPPTRWFGSSDNELFFRRIRRPLEVFFDSFDT